MTLSRISLESFERDGAGQPVQSPDFQRGFQDGLAVAQQEIDATRVATLADLVSTLADMSFGFTEARTLVISSLKPILAQLAETVLPTILHETFGAHLIEVIETEFDKSADRPIEIAIAPDVATDLTDFLPTETITQFSFVADPNLIPGQALVRQGDTFTLIDLPALVNTLQTALRGLETIERIPSHG